MPPSKEQITEMGVQAEEVAAQMARVVGGARAATNVAAGRDNHEEWSRLREKLDLLAFEAVAASRAVQVLLGHNRASGVEDAH